MNRQDKLERYHRLQHECMLLAGTVQNLFKEHDIPKPQQAALLGWCPGVDHDLTAPELQSTHELAESATALKKLRDAYEQALAALPPDVRIAYLKHGEVNEIMTGLQIELGL